jgi:hypothetical protein
MEILAKNLGLVEAERFIMLILIWGKLLKILKIYLETTVFNFRFADDSPDKKQDTIKLFDEISQGKYIPYTSDYVLQELLNG